MITQGDNSIARVSMVATLWETRLFLIKVSPFSLTHKDRRTDSWVRRKNTAHLPAEFLAEFALKSRILWSGQSFPNEQNWAVLSEISRIFSRISKSAEFFAECVLNFARIVTKIKEQCDNEKVLTEVERIVSLLNATFHNSHSDQAQQDLLAWRPLLSYPGSFLIGA